MRDEKMAKIVTRRAQDFLARYETWMQTGNAGNDNPAGMLGAAVAAIQTLLDYAVADEDQGKVQAQDELDSATAWNAAQGYYDHLKDQEPAQEQDPAMLPAVITLYETNAASLVVSRGSAAWDFGSIGDQTATFAEDARAWADGDWEPSVADGQTPTTTDGLTAVATFDGQRVWLSYPDDQIGAAARSYISG